MYNALFDVCQKQKVKHSAVQVIMCSTADAQNTTTKDLLLVLCRRIRRATHPPGQPPSRSIACKRFSGIRQPPLMARRLSIAYRPAEDTHNAVCHPINPIQTHAGMAQRSRACASTQKARRPAQHGAPSLTPRRGLFADGYLDQSSAGLSRRVRWLPSSALSRPRARPRRSSIPCPASRLVSPR